MGAGSVRPDAPGPRLTYDSLVPAAPPNPNLAPISLKDFTPGIADLPSANYPPTQATRTNTYRCIAQPSGTLSPLFGTSTSYPGVDFNSGTPSGGAYLIDGFFAAGPLIPGTGVTPSSRPHELWLGTEYTTATNRIHKLERLLVDENPMVREVIKTDTLADTSQALNGWGMTWGSTRDNYTTPDTPGIPVVVAAWSPPLTGTGGWVVTFPDSNAPTATGLKSVLVDTQTLVVCHQNRLILRRNTAYGHGKNSGGTNTMFWSTTEDLYFTDPNNVTVINGPEAFVPESPDGYSVMAPMSANELFALKQSGGVMIQGDIAQPLVVNLPMVAGAGDGGVHTRAGFMYAATNTGLWNWPHGDTSQSVSPLLNPDFYQITPEYLVAQRYQWDSVENYVFLSNNFVYDTDTKAFWMLEDPSVARFRFMAHRLQWLYGAVSTYVPSALTAIYSWDMTTKATSFSWQSHPLWVTLDRVVDIRALTVRAQGTGTVTITVSGLDTPARTQTFTFASTFPELQRLNSFSYRGQAIQVRIESSATGSSTEAPTVYEVTLDPSERQRVGSAA